MLGRSDGDCDCDCGDCGDDDDDDDDDVVGEDSIILILLLVSRPVGAWLRFFSFFVVLSVCCWFQ